MKHWIALLLLTSISSQAATWYIDSSVSSSGNGQSWSTAWKQISNIAGVGAGDIVYISGGTNGSSQTYTLTGSWSPIGGTSVNRITYQIGQDSLHNGTAYFSGPNVPFLGNTIQNINISGDAGDGLMHFAIANPSTGISPWSALIINNQSGNMLNFKVDHLNLGSINGQSVGGNNIYTIYMNGGGHTMGPNIQFSHMYAKQTDLNSDGFFQGFSFASATGYDQNIIIDNCYFLVPTAVSGFGSDGIKAQIQGMTLSNLFMGSYYASYTASQHGDGTQFLNANAWVSVVNSWFANFNDCGILFGVNSSLRHIKVLNCIVTDPAQGSPFPGGGITPGWDNGPAIAYQDITVANCLCDNVGQGIRLGNTTDTSLGSTYSQCQFVNNVLVNNTDLVLLGASTINVDNVFVTSGQAPSYYVSYQARQTNSDFHLLAGAANVIGKGTNLGSVFNFDKDGNGRPILGTWDVGPFVFNGGSGNTNPPVITLDLTNITVAANNAATFGIGNLYGTSYAWYTNNIVALSGGVNFSSYTISPATLSQNGLLVKVIVSNNNGSVTSSIVTLTVYQIPTITQQPIGTTNIIGSSPSLSLIAVGTAPISYFWKSNSVGSVLSTNNTLNIVNAQTNNSGTYFCVLTNLYGSVTSSSVNVLITNTLPPPFAVYVSSTNVNFGSIATNTTITGGITITNNQNFPEILLATAPPSPFLNISPPGTLSGIPVGGKTNWSWSFTPGSVAGQFSYNVTIATIDGQSTNINLTGISTNVIGATTNTYPILSVVPASYNFGSVVVSNTATTTLTLNNVGTSNLVGSASVNPPFFILSGTPYTIGTNSFSNMQISFSPTNTGTFTNNISFIGGSSSTIPLIGNSVNPVAFTYITNMNVGTLNIIGH